MEASLKNSGRSVNNFLASWIVATRLWMHTESELDLIDERKTPIAKVFKAEGDSMTYVDYFGDDWRHEVVLEKVIPVNDGVKTPICFAGERRRRPEDVGSVSGYQEFLEVIFDPAHEEYEHLVGWAGGPFQAGEFNAKAVNGVLSRMRWPIRHRR